MVEIVGLYETLAHHQRPQSIGDVLVEDWIGPASRDRGQPGPSTEPGHRENILRWLHLVFLARRKNRLAHLRLAEDSRTRQVLVVLDEDRVEREIVARLLGVVGLVLAPFLARKGVRRPEERQEAVIIRLLIVVDQGMIMALSTLQVATKKDARRRLA